MRELEHVVTAAAAMAPGDEIRAADLGFTPAAPADGPPLEELWDLPLTKAKARLADWFESAAIERALRGHSGNVSAAARQLGIHRQSLQHKLRRRGDGA